MLLMQQCNKTAASDIAAIVPREFTYQTPSGKYLTTAISLENKYLQPQAPPLLLTGGLRPQATPYAFQHSATGHVLQPSAKEFWRNKSSYETMASQSTTSSPTDDVTELPDGLPPPTDGATGLQENVSLAQWLENLPGAPARAAANIMRPQANMIG